MFYLLALLMCLAPSTKVHAMMLPTANATLIHRTPQALPISGYEREQVIMITRSLRENPCARPTPEAMAQHPLV